VAILTLVFAAAGYLILTWVFGHALYPVCVGLAMELSLWLPRDYQLDLPEAPDLLFWAFGLISLSLGSRAAVALLVYPGPYGIKSSREEFRAGMHSANDDARTSAYLTLMLVKPFSSVEWRCLLVLIVLTFIGFPHFERERVEAKQYAIVEKLDWLDIDIDLARWRGLGYPDAVESLLLDGRTNIRPYLNCKVSRDLPVAKSMCTEAELKQIYDLMRGEYWELDLLKRSMGDDAAKPRWWIPLLIAVWLFGVFVWSKDRGARRATRS
jgi:hypothetical protein